MAKKGKTTNLTITSIEQIKSRRREWGLGFKTGVILNKKNKARNRNSKQARRERASQCER